MCFEADGEAVYFFGDGLVGLWRVDGFWFGFVFLFTHHAFLCFEL